MARFNFKRLRARAGEAAKAAGRATKRGAEVAGAAAIRGEAAARTSAQAVAAASQRFKSAEDRLAAAKARHAPFKQERAQAAAELRVAKASVTEATTLEKRAAKTLTTAERQVARARRAAKSDVQKADVFAIERKRVDPAKRDHTQAAAILSKATARLNTATDSKRSVDTRFSEADFKFKLAKAEVGTTRAAIVRVKKRRPKRKKLIGPTRKVRRPRGETVTIKLVR